VPDVYSQNATSSLVVAAGAKSALSLPTSSAYDSWPADAFPATTTFVRPGTRGRTTSMAGTSGSLAMTTAARLSRRMYSRSWGLSSVLVGIGTAPILSAPQKLHTKGRIVQQ